MEGRTLSRGERMSEVAITDADAEAGALKRVIARHPWWWFFLVALVPTDS